jgi:hypothetical protein
MEIAEAQVSKISHVQCTNIMQGIELLNRTYGFVTIRLPDFIYR